MTSHVLGQIIAAAGTQVAFGVDTAWDAVKVVVMGLVAIGVLWLGWLGPLSHSLFGWLQALFT